MKNSLIIFSLIIGLFNCKKSTYSSSNYIEFEHTGAQGKFIRPLYISVKQLSFQLNYNEMKELKRIAGPTITKKQNEQYLRACLNF